MVTFMGVLHFHVRGHQVLPLVRYELLNEASSLSDVLWRLVEQLEP
jgi:hypothetical protein